MNKELQALKRFKNNIRWLEENTSLKHYFENNELHFKEDLDIIEKALKQQENDREVWERYLKEIKNLPPIEVQMRLKALKIIKEKKVNAGEFIDMLEDWPTITYEDWLIYKEENGYYLQDELTEFELGIIIKEEFDLLKEVLL